MSWEVDGTGLESCSKSGLAINDVKTWIMLPENGTGPCSGTIVNVCSSLVYV